MLVGQEETKKQNPNELIWKFSDTFPRPMTTPAAPKKPVTTRRFNPLLNMLEQNSTKISVANSTLDSTSFQSFSSATTGSQNIARGKAAQHRKTSELEAFYRIALQNQATVTSVDKAEVEQRKLLDKQFASQYRALKGGFRSAGVTRVQSNLN